MLSRSAGVVNEYVQSWYPVVDGALHMWIWLTSGQSARAAAGASASRPARQSGAIFDRCMRGALGVVGSNRDNEDGRVAVGCQGAARAAHVVVRFPASTLNPDARFRYTS